MNKIARYITIAAIACIVLFLCWYFSTVLTYILISVVIALISKPAMNMLCRLRIGKYRIPRTLAAMLTLIIVMGLILGILAFITPLVARTVSHLGSIDFNSFRMKVSEPLQNWNMTIHRYFPDIDPEFSIESIIFRHLTDFISSSVFSDLFNSLTSMVINFGIAIFSISFISFFFIKDDNTFTSMLTAIVPDKYENKIINAMSSINNLLVRYFLGISLEALLITVLNTAGLHFIAGFDFTTALVLAFFSGIINVIPYIGPLTGGAVGVLVGMVTYHPEYSSMSLTASITVIIAVYTVTHLIDVFLFQPFIYSNSVKAHPLEIFIVILMAAHIGGVIGMLIAIPSYTVIRVFAKEFLAEVKIVQKLTKKF